MLIKSEVAIVARKNMSCNGRMCSMLSTLQEACNKYVDLYVVNVHSR